MLSLPSVLPALPICRTNLPVLSNFSTCASAARRGREPRRVRRAPARRRARRRRAPAAGAGPRPRAGGASDGVGRPPADPDVALVVDGDAGRIVRPVVAGAGLRIPVRDQRAGRVELENLRRGEAARARPRLERRTLFVGLQRIDAAMHDPDVILRVDGDAGHRAENPRVLLRERFRPERIDLDRRRRGLRLRGERHERGRTDARCGQEREQAPTNANSTLHATSPLMRKRTEWADKIVGRPEYTAARGAE